MARTGVYGLVVAAVLVAGTVTACGEKTAGTEGAEVLVETGEAPATPYAGPLYVPLPKEEYGDDPSRAEVMAMAGAAGRALECDGDIYSGGGSERWPEDDGGATPEEGLAWHWEIDGGQPPSYAFRVERREADRVLFSYDVDGRTKEAVIVAKDRPDRPGWGPETSARCDPSEFAPSADADGWYRIWTDEEGSRVPVSVVHSSVGTAHCDWQSAHFLTLGENANGAGGTTYARDPEGVLGDAGLAVPYDPDAELPDGATDTGYRLDDWRLWVDEGDETRVYVRTPDAVEVWPRFRGGCD